MIRVEHLTKNYGPRVAVADVTFDVEQGEVLGFLGPNGAGKTTTMRILTGYLPPSGDAPKSTGFDVATQSLPARANIGYLPETVPLYPDMSVRSYLDFMGKIKGVKDRRRAGRSRDGKSANRAPSRRPDRQAVQRLAAARRARPGAARRPAGLILDEPTSGLDPRRSSRLAT